MPPSPVAPARTPGVRAASGTRGPAAAPVRQRDRHRCSVRGFPPPTAAVRRGPNEGDVVAERHLAGVDGFPFPRVLVPFGLFVLAGDGK